MGGPASKENVVGTFQRLEVSIHKVNPPLSLESLKISAKQSQSIIGGRDYYLSDWPAPRDPTFQIIRPWDGECPMLGPDFTELTPTGLPVIARELAGTRLSLGPSNGLQPLRAPGTSC